MVVPLPHKTHTEYHRDFLLGILEKFCPEICPICQALIYLFGFRKRKIMSIFLLRGRCKGPIVHHFTFLPLFVAPAKWYGYETIETALISVNQSGFSTFSAALADWEKARETRIEDHQSPGPCSRTISRWDKELGQNHPKRPWAQKAQETLSQMNKPVHEQKSASSKRKTLKPLAAAPISTRDKKFTVRLLVTLRLLGKTLLGMTSFPETKISLGIGIWFLESSCQQRCLARFELAGNVVPGPVPEVSMTEFLRRGYPPFS